MTISNISSKATGLLVTKFHVKPPEGFGMIICSNCPGHMTTEIVQLMVLV